MDTDESTISIIISMLNSISKEVDEMKTNSVTNPLDRIDEMYTEYNDIIEDFRDIIKKDIMVGLLSGRVKNDLDLYNKECRSKQINIKNHAPNFKVGYNKHMTKKEKKRIDMVNDIWEDNNNKDKKIGLRLQNILDTIKYINKPKEGILLEHENIKSNKDDVISNKEIIDVNNLNMSHLQISTDDEIERVKQNINNYVIDQKLNIDLPSEEPLSRLNDGKEIIEIGISFTESSSEELDFSYKTDTEVEPQSQSETNDRVILFKNICDEYYGIADDYEKTIANDMCLTILATNIESAINEYFAGNK